MTPYKWGSYAVLVLPGMFFMGGMENANVTFVSPTIITNDRSSSNVVAHEIAHSWSGNYVTNSTWGEFFINEGLTMFLEYKALEKTGCSSKEIGLRMEDDYNNLKNHHKA